LYEQKQRILTFDELLGMYQNNEKFILLDARSREDYDKGHLPGALSIPLEDIKDFADRLDKGEKIVTYCGGFQCPLSTEAAKELKKLGFQYVCEYKGGMQEWAEKGYPIETS